MIADAVGVGKGVLNLMAGNIAYEIDGFEHRYIRMARSAHVVNLPFTQPLVYTPERTDKVLAVDIIANLFSIVSEDGIGLAVYGTLDQIRKKSVQLCATVRWPGE